MPESKLGSFSFKMGPVEAPSSPLASQAGMLLHCQDPDSCFPGLRPPTWVSASGFAFCPNLFSLPWALPPDISFQTKPYSVAPWLKTP